MEYDARFYDMTKKVNQDAAKAQKLSGPRKADMCRFCESDDIRKHTHNTGIAVVEIDGWYCGNCGKAQ